MASALQIGNIAREGGCNAVVDLLDAGAGASILTIRTGAPPANNAAADTGTLLSTHTATDPAFGNASTSGVASANAIGSAVAAASGIAGHWRWKDSNGVCILQGSAGEAADTPDMTLDDKDIVMGGNVNVNSGTFTMPAT